ncbi:hypothetical protein UlMin_022451 [Ulmus minor]
MANGSQNPLEIPENLRKHLAVAVRSIHWSYAIFWSLSTTQQGVLEWREGYYNGDIKTRKTLQEMELKPDKIGLQRSEQLRELYKSLLEGETEQQAKKPSASLSPEDLTDAEWYYLVCMSFLFSPGQGLPGQALERGETIWLCNAHYADCKVFSRSLLAKSASIQTVVCFPHLGGVIEMGVTELIPEDPSLLQHIKASLLDFSKPVCSEKSSPLPQRMHDDREKVCLNVDNEMVDMFASENLYSPSEDTKLDGNCEELNMDSVDECSLGCEHNHQTEDSFMRGGINGGASQVQSWHFMDDDFSIGLQDSMHSSDCISQAFVNQEKALSSSRNEKLNHVRFKEIQNSNYHKLISLNLEADGDDLHYKKTLSAILGGSSHFIENPCLCNSTHSSSFAVWRKRGDFDGCRQGGKQKMLKKILFTVPFMYEKLGKDLPANCENGSTGNLKFEKLKENENCLALKSMVPSIQEIDKASTLNNTIKYLKKLEERVEELESCIDPVNYEARARKKHQDIVEQISENCKNGKIENVKTNLINKRKAYDIDETDSDPDINILEDGRPLDLKVGVKEQEVHIEMRCPYREYILLEIMDAINDLHLDAHSVQSSTLDGVLTLSLKSKFRGAAVAPVGIIKQALWKFAGKC